MNCTYWDLWDHWIKGESVANYYWFGCKLIWWGRLGKTLQFLSIISVIIEIIGANRINSLGMKLRSLFTYEKIYKSLNIFFKSKSMFYIYVVVFFLFLLSIDFFINKFEIKIFNIKWLTYLTIPLDLLLVYFIWYIFSDSMANLLSFIFSFIFSYSVIILDKIFIDSIASILAQKKFDLLIKLVTLLFFIIGFQFDLLSS